MRWTVMGVCLATALLGAMPGAATPVSISVQGTVTLVEAYSTALDDYVDPAPYGWTASVGDSFLATFVYDTAFSNDAVAGDPANGFYADAVQSASVVVGALSANLLPDPTQSNYVSFKDDWSSPARDLFQARATAMGGPTLGQRAWLDLNFATGDTSALASDQLVALPEGVSWSASSPALYYGEFDGAVSLGIGADIVAYQVHAPEPGTATLLALGLGGMAVRRAGFRRRAEV